MQIWESILYGFVQGVSEYLPISSSAHLILLPHFLGHEDPGLAFDVFLHLGTLGATLTYFWREWLVLLKNPKVEAPPIILATIPALVVGAALHHWIKTALRGTEIISFALAIGGILLFAVDRFSRGMDSDRGISLKKAFLIGVAQCMALIPGMSRSGSTIIGGRLLGLSREASARFSFMISAPVVAAALVFELKDFREMTVGLNDPAILVAGGVSSFVFGMLSIGGLLALLRRVSFLGFAIYRIALAVLVWVVLV